MQWLIQTHSNQSGCCPLSHETPAVTGQMPKSNNGKTALTQKPKSLLEESHIFLPAGCAWYEKLFSKNEIKKLHFQKGDHASSFSVYRLYCLLLQRFKLSWWIGGMIKMTFEKVAVLSFTHVKKKIPAARTVLMTASIILLYTVSASVLCVNGQELWYCQSVHLTTL